MPDRCTDKPRDCPLIPRVEALEQENRRHTETHKEMFSRLNKVEQDNAVQSEQYKTILEKLDAHDKKQDVMNDRLQAMEAKPGNMWNDIVKSVITAIGSAFIMWIACGMPGVNR